VSRSRGRAQQRGDLLVDTSHILCAGCAARRQIAQLERDDFRTGVVGDEQDVVRTKGQGAAGRQRRALGRRHHRLRRQDERAHTDDRAYGE
jgi:hypothetical protein